MPSNFNPDKGKQRLLPAAQLLGMRTEEIRDLDPSNSWFGPLSPVLPVAPSTYRTRQWGYTMGSNLIWTPKSEEGGPAVDFQTLRDLADAWDLLRIVIETQKDRLCSQKWEIRAIVQPGESNKDRKQRSLKDPNIKLLTEFWAKPDGFHSFRQWLRMLLEDTIVIDATAVYMARDLQGKIATVHPIAGDTINRVLTEQGITPPPPNVAYQQIIYGMPAIDLQTSDLVYSMRNERTNKRYGYSPVEQIINYVCFGLRRLEWQINEYTSGSVPEAMVFLPSDLPIDRVKEVQEWFDSILAGDAGARRKVRFLPGYGTGDQARPNVIFPKEPLLKDELDVWLAQIVCMCIGISAQPFMKMMNRASAEQAQEASEEEGTAPYIAFVADIINTIIQDQMGFKQYEMVPQDKRELDVLKQAQADNLLIGKAFTINEVREKRGEDPRDEPEANALGMFSPQNGFIPLGGFDPSDPRAQQKAPPPGSPAAAGQSASGGEGEQEPSTKAKPNGKAPAPPNGKVPVPRGKMEQVLKATRDFIQVQKDAVNYSALCEKVGIENVEELMKHVHLSDVQQDAEDKLSATPGIEYKGEFRDDLSSTENFFLGVAHANHFKRDLVLAYKDSGSRAVIEETLSHAEERIVEPVALWATQTWVERGRVIEYIEGREKSLGASRDMPWVVREAGVDKVMDGHHRLTADILMGTETRLVKYTDLVTAKKILASAVLMKGLTKADVAGREELLKYSDDQPRDEHGRFTNGSGGVSFLDPAKMSYHEREAMLVEMRNKWPVEKGTAEHQAIRDYSGPSYAGINRMLRRDEEDDLHADRILTASNLDFALAKAPATDKDMLLYRGLGNNTATRVEKLAESDKLEKFTDKGFVSTSLDPAQASINFAANRGDVGGRVVAQIEVPAGSRVGPIDGISDMTDEQEILLGRNASFTVLGSYETSFKSTSGVNVATKVIRMRYEGSAPEPLRKMQKMMVEGDADVKLLTHPGNDHEDKFTWTDEDLVFEEKITKAFDISKLDFVNLTKTEKSKAGWVGVDLDRTLAVGIEHQGQFDPLEIGPPVPRMVARVKRWLKVGHPGDATHERTKDIRIFTARVVDDNEGHATKIIQEWTMRYIGQLLPVQSNKDQHMVAFYDDKARRVEPDTGVLKLAKYDPEQPRDEQGRFGSTSGWQKQGGGYKVKDLGNGIELSKPPNGPYTIAEPEGRGHLAYIHAQVDGKDLRVVWMENVGDNKVGTSLVRQSISSIMDLTGTETVSGLRVSGARQERTEITVHKAVKKHTAHYLDHYKKLHDKLKSFFHKTAVELADRVRKVGRGAGNKVAKANWNPADVMKLVTPIDWSALGVVDEDIIGIAEEAATVALTSLGSADELIAEGNATAADWARNRAAELIGKRRTESGKLIDNPDARWSIAETTREDLQDIITDAFSKETTIDELADSILNAGSFSESRALTIANTESSRAANMGNLLGWRTSGVVEEVEVVLGGDHDQDDECDDAVEDGPYAIDDVPDVPLHPNCSCTLIVSKIAGMGDDEEEED